jgi:Flp pilus assembly protein TadD
LAARLRGLFLLAVLSSALAACQTTQSSKLADPMTTGSTEEAVPSIKEVALAGKNWREDPGNAKLGIEYARRLEALKKTNEQLKVLEEVARRNPENAGLQAYYGKQLAYQGRAAEAERVLRRVLAQGGEADWKIHSALGSALDQQGRYAEAREQYSIALKARPNEPSVMNNLGMSFMLEGDLKQAEETLRRAMAAGNGAAEPRLRQNLALSVGLQGRFDEAREIASRDLPQEQVEANMAYLKTMLTQANTWQQLQAVPQTKS